MIPTTPSGSYTNAECLVFEEQLRHRDLLLGEDLDAGLRDPIQRVDRRQQLHRERLVARLALLADDQVADLVGLLEQHFGRALEVRARAPAA